MLLKTCITARNKKRRLKLIRDNRPAAPLPPVWRNTHPSTNLPEYQAPTKIKQNTQTNIKVLQAETNIVDTESASEPQRNQSKQTSTKSVPKSSNVINRETLQLIQETISAISSSMNLNENIAMKLQKVHVSRHSEHSSATVTVNGKEHSLPTTKKYILKEYADVFTGIRILQGPAYHIELTEDYSSVRNPPHSVSLGMQDAYKAELQRLE